jgi:HlyD family secretion protein
MTASTLSPAEVLAKVGRPAPKGARRFLRWGAVLAVVAGGLTAFVLLRGRADPASAMRFLTQPVKRGDLASTISATGTLEGKDTVTVGAETSGRVHVVHVDFNDMVKAGQVLAEIDPSTIKAALQQARAQLASARANVKSAEATAREAGLAAERTRTLSRDGLVSAQQLETAQAMAERAQAAVETARAQVIVSQAVVDSNQTTLGKTQVRSPIDGVVLSRRVEAGQALVAAMQTPELFVVARSLREMEVTIGIDEADVGRAQVGQQATFTVDAFPGRTFPGVLRSIHNVAVKKDNVVTYEALLAVDNEDLALRPGMTATVTIHTDERHGVLLVPNAALRFEPPSTAKPRGFGPPPHDDTRSALADRTPHVWLLAGGQPVKVIVRRGLTDGVLTEVEAPQLGEGLAVITDAEHGGAAR